MSGILGYITRLSQYGSSATVFIMASLFILFLVMGLVFINMSGQINISAVSQSQKTKTTSKNIIKKNNMDFVDPINESDNIPIIPAGNDLINKSVNTSLINNSSMPNIINKPMPNIINKPMPNIINKPMPNIIPNIINKPKILNLINNSSTENMTDTGEMCIGETVLFYRLGIISLILAGLFLLLFISTLILVLGSGAINMKILTN